MKTALCLVGMTRTFEKCLPSLRQNIIDVVNPDIFCCSHDYNEIVQKELNPRAYLICDLKMPTHLYDAQIISANIRPEIITPKGADNMILSLYKQLLISETLVNYELYDQVIIARFDLEYRQPINVEYKSGITIPKGHDYRDGINDQIAWGDTNNMLFYASRLKYVNSYVLHGIAVHPESILRVHLEGNGKMPERVDFNYSIVR